MDQLQNHNKNSFIYRKNREMSVLTSFEHDSDEVSASVRKRHWSVQMTLKHTLSGNIA